MYLFIQLCVYTYTYIYIYIYILHPLGPASHGPDEGGGGSPCPYANLVCLPLCVICPGHLYKWTLALFKTSKPRESGPPDWDVGGIPLEISSSFLLAQQTYHGPQFTSICVKHRGVPFHRIRNCKHYYFNSIPPASHWSGSQERAACRTPAAGAADKHLCALPITRSYYAQSAY